MMNKIMVLLADGCEEVEALTVVDLLRRADLDVTMVSITDNLLINGAHNIGITADATINEINPAKYNAAVLPGGMPGSTNLRDNEKVQKIVTDFNKDKKLIAAICAAPMVFGHLGILKDRCATCYPGMEENLKDAVRKTDKVVVDGNIITSRGPATAMNFALSIIEYLLSKEVANNVAEGLLFNM